MPGTAVTKSVVANEPGGRKREEIFVDIIEKISVTFSSSVSISCLHLVQLYDFFFSSSSFPCFSIHLVLLSYRNLPKPKQMQLRVNPISVTIM